MSSDSAFSDAKHYEPAEWNQIADVAVPAHFGDVAAEYRVAKEGLAVFDREDRGLIGLTGEDRKEWLHNLVTNQVKTLEPHTGNYAFATDVRGRYLFDMNILSLEDAVWLDVSREALPAARAHFEKYLITEDVEIADISASFVRIGVSGSETARVAEALGRSNFAPMSDLSSFGLASEKPTVLVRHDFAGVAGFELYVPPDEAATWWDRLVEEFGAKPAGWRALDVLRIEAGIPWTGQDLDEKVIPPETGQVERGISYHKGCYLGQEVIERMRSHGVLARRLVRVKAAQADVGAELPARLSRGGQEVGRLMSLVDHPVESGAIGLAYLKSNTEVPAELAVGEGEQTVTAEREVKA